MTDSVWQSAFYWCLIKSEQMSGHQKKTSENPVTKRELEGGWTSFSRSNSTWVPHLIEERRICSFLRDCWKAVCYFDGWGGWTISWTLPGSPSISFKFISTVSWPVMIFIQSVLFPAPSSSSSCFRGTWSSLTLDFSTTPLHKGAYLVLLLWKPHRRDNATRQQPLKSMAKVLCI